MNQTQTSILEATLRVIVKGGVNAVRYREVAAEGGGALGTISYQYRTREDLIRSAFQYFLSENTATLRGRLEKHPVRTPEDLSELVVESTVVELQDPRKPCVAEYELIVYAARDPVIAQALAEWERLVIAELGELVERVGGIAPFAIAQTIMDVTRGFQITALSQREPDFAGFKQRVLRLILALCPKRDRPAKKRTLARKRRARQF